MMSSPSELTLDCKPTSYSLLLKSIGEQTDHTQKLQEFLTRLEEERLKIDAFKRELPLCMQLLSNAMEASRLQLQTYQANQGAKPVLEEFIPLKNSSSEGGSEKASSFSDKATWMTSAQLWSQASGDGKKQQSTIQGSDMGLSPKLGGLDTKHRNGGGAFLPFSKERNNNLPDLALADKEMMDQHNKCSDSDDGINNSSKGGANVVVVEQPSVPAESLTTTTTTTTTNSQTHRKARRCWSPDLHRRFVNALHMLGGSQVATPKQIRELMKVDGLTNDEVKSHLQKYRLHTRRPSPSPQATGNQGPGLVVGIWVPPEYASAAHHGGAPALYGAHPTTNYCTVQAVPQEFYPAPTQPQLHHHTLHHQLHVYNPSSQTHSSPDSDIRGGTGDRSESIEDGKSESSSWKADSGCENGGERKGLVLREDGEESRRGVGDITLKF